MVYGSAKIGANLCTVAKVIFVEILKVVSHDRKLINRLSVVVQWEDIVELRNAVM